MKEVPCECPIPIIHRELLSKAISNELSMKLVLSSGTFFTTPLNALSTCFQDTIMDELRKQGVIQGREDDSPIVKDCPSMLYYA